MTIHLFDRGDADMELVCMLLCCIGQLLQDHTSWETEIIGKMKNESGKTKTKSELIHEWKKTGLIL